MSGSAATWDRGVNTPFPLCPNHTGLSSRGAAADASTRATMCSIFGAIGVLSDYKNRPASFDNAWQRFRLMQQSDGSHALLTSNGVNYVTAVQGGGLASGGITTDDLVTDRTQVQAWEKFRFVEHGSCTYVIQTATGHYLGKKTATTGIGLFATNITDINKATKFRVSMVF